MSESESSRKSTGYQDLIAWQKAMTVIDCVYALTDRWPGHETFGLRSQVRRAVVSVAANIAEGQGRNGRKEIHQHLGIAYGSLCEVETMIQVGFRQQYRDDNADTGLLALCTEVGRLVRGLRIAIQSPPA